MFVTFSYTVRRSLNGPFTAFIDEQEKALRYIRESSAISTEEKKRFYRSINTNLGATALCLSGGASFGYCTIIAHFIVPAPNSRLAQIISGWLRRFWMRTSFRVSSPVPPPEA